MAGNSRPMSSMDGPIQKRPLEAASQFRDLELEQEDQKRVKARKPFCSAAHAVYFCVIKLQSLSTPPLLSEGTDGVANTGTQRKCH